jgi:hypothetical protein
VSLKKVGHRSGTPSKRTEETQLLRLPWRKGWFHVAVAVAPDEVCCVDVWRVRIDAHAKKEVWIRISTQTALSGFVYLDKVGLGW